MISHLKLWEKNNKEMRKKKRQWNNWFGHTCTMTTGQEVSTCRISSNLPNNADLCWCLNSSCQISDHRFLMICHLKLREKKSCHEKKNNNNNGTTGLVIYYDHSPCEMTLRIPRNS